MLSELISTIQNVEGVAYVDVDAFGGIPERVANNDGTRRLLTLQEMADRVAEIIGTNRLNSLSQTVLLQNVPVNQADFEKGAVRPAQLAIFTNAVPDTIVLNQIKFNQLS